MTLLENSSGFAIPTVYLLTDGEATSGVTDPDVILNTINYVMASRKIHINTIALGTEVTSSLVNRLARLGDPDTDYGMEDQRRENQPPLDERK